MSIRKFLLFFAILSLLFTPKAFAVEIPTKQPEFSTSFDILYDIDQSGATFVTQKGSLKNLTPQYYANQYKLDIPSTQISDIKASDGGGEAQVSVTAKGTLNEAIIKFNQQITGLNKAINWTLQYKSKDYAQNFGKAQEIKIPKITAQNNLEGVNITISVPVKWGEPSFINPTPRKQTTSGDKLLFTFEKNQIISNGISIIFGLNQVYDFNLTYHLVNNTFFRSQTNIALPPDTAYQDIIFNQIEPKPINVTLDDEGNYLAWYQLSRKSGLDVKVSGSAKLYIQSKVKNPILDVNLKQKYIQADQHWDANNLQTISKVTEILNQKDIPQKARLIYQYVVKNTPGNLTNSFIALARAAGIPARELDGIAKGSVHIWPEYWDDMKGWVMVDSTWENSTGGANYFDILDLDHLVFEAKGSGTNKSILPDVLKVGPGDKDFLGEPKLDVQIDSSNPILSGFPEKIKVKVFNIGNGIYPTNDFVVSANNLSVLDGNSQKLGPIPAFGYAAFDFNVRTKGLFESFSDQITVKIGSKIFTKDVKVLPFILFRTYPAIGIGIISLMGVLYLTVLGKHIHKIHKSKPAKKPKKSKK